MSDHTVAIVSEHGAIVRMVDRVRRKLAQADISWMSLEINVEGDVNKRPTMTYIVDLDRYSSDFRVKGNNLDEVVREALRRKGWTEHNKPLELTFEPNGDAPHDAGTSDEIEL